LRKREVDMSLIIEIRAREVLDSRGNPTIEVECITESGAYGRAIVPSGASKGKYEALELRDGDEKRFMGKGVLKAVENVNEVIAPEVVGEDCLEQAWIDRLLCELDGTENKSKLGANAILGVSLAVAKAGADFLGLPLYRYLGGVNARKLPIPFINILNGGKHADNNLDIQEFMVVPHGAPSMKEAIRYGAEVFHTLKKILKGKGYFTGVGDEGGFAPSLSSNEEALQLLVEAIKEAGYTPGNDVSLALDCAASEFWKDGKYVIDGKERTTEEMVKIYEEWVEKYPIVLIEDGLSQDDWDGWVMLTERLGGKIRIMGDDLYVTNTERIKEGIERKASNAVLIKLNQIGTVTETIEAIELAKNAGWLCVVSHRSGETEDVSIAHLAVALNTGGIKTGSLSRSERVAKYNELIRIEENLGEVSIFPKDEVKRKEKKG